MFYKLQYNIEDDPKPHHRYYSALSPDIAASMFEATCEDGSLTGEHVTLLSIEPLSTRGNEYIEDSSPTLGLNEQIG